MNRPTDLMTEPSEKEIAALKIFMHYQYHQFFMGENPDQIINNIDQLPDVPIFFVHGADDRVTPVEHAELLAQKLIENNHDDMELLISPNTGHLATEPRNFDNLLRATNKIKERFPLKKP